jgi:hypothetical protein
MKYIPILLIVIISLLITSCLAGDGDYKMSSKTQKSNNFLVRQAHKITGKNIKNRGAKVKKSTRDNKNLSKEIQESNEKASKVKKPKKHSGEFKFY